MSSTPQEFPQATLPQNDVSAPGLGLGISPGYTLFDAVAVGLATFFGTPVAGGLLMMLNESRLGRTGRGVALFVGTIVLTGLVILVGWNIPTGASSAIALALVIAMRYTATGLEGKAVDEHVKRGGQLGSRWVAFGIGVLFLALLFGGVFLGVYLTSVNSGPKVVVGSKDEVYYKGGATQADATTLGNALKADGYFTDKGVTVILDKSAGTAISFVVKEGSWDQPENVSTFDEIGREVAPSLGGFPVKVRLLNKAFDMKNETTVGKLTVGNDHIYYFGSSTDAQAQALGEALKSAGFFVGKGFDVFLNKQSDGTTLSFIVGDGAWDDAALVSNFETITRQAAPAIGGLPVRLRLENTVLEVKKDEMVK
jgi:hypothetical protein